MSKGLLEFSIWQESPSIAFLFLKATPLFITLYSSNRDQKILPFGSPFPSHLLYSIPAWESSPLWGRQMG